MSTDLEPLQQVMSRRTTTVRWSSVTPGEATQILVGFGALVTFLTGVSALHQRQRLEFIRESVRAAKKRLEDLAERQDAPPLPATAMNQELRPAAADPLGVLIISLSIVTAAAVSAVRLQAVQQGLFRSEEIAGLLSASAVALVVVTSAVGRFDVLWTEAGENDTALVHSAPDGHRAPALLHHRATRPRPAVAPVPRDAARSR